MKTENIKTGISLFLVKPNTAEDPLKCYEKMIPYKPLVINKMDVANGIYDYYGVNEGNDPLLCFDVVGMHGTINKGQSDNTRRVWIGEIGLSDNAQEDCLFAFLTEVEAEAKVKDMVSEENLYSTLAFSLDNWGMGTNKDNVDHFVKMFHEL